MNFGFSFSSDGGMIIRNGNQVIKMGGNGMTITNPGGQRIVMNANGIHISNATSNITVNSNSFGRGNININTNISYGGNDWDSEYSEEENVNEGYSIDSSFEEDQAYEHYPNYNVQYNMNYGNNHYHHHFNNSHLMNYPHHHYHHHQQQMHQEPPKKEGLTQAEINQLPISVHTIKKTPVKPTLFGKSSATKTGTKESVKKEESTGPSSNQSCAICIGDYKHGDRLRTLPCLHKFHVECIDKWLKKKSECPICKLDLLE
jgi:RING-finger-containing ubiquitin ligase